jgi:hypothetical protein
MTRRALVALVLVLLGLAPGAAQAASVAVAGDTLTYRATPGKRTFVQLSQADPDTVRIERFASQDSDPFAPGPGCAADDATPGDDLRCDGVARVDAELGDGVDLLFARFATAGGILSLQVPLRVAAGTGGDVVQGGSGGDTVLGEGGDDILDGGRGADLVDGGEGSDLRVGGGDEADVVLGGPGADSLDGDDPNESGGAAGADRLDGGPGSDVLQGDGAADVLIGGDDFDTVTYYEFTPSTEDDPAVFVSLDGRANDGQAGEGDDVRADVEDVDGSEGPDTVTGDAGPNVLTARQGADTLDPGDGEDQVDAGRDDDTVTTRDGFADRVTCGSGTDRALADTLDQVSGDCERVERRDAGNRRDVPEDVPPAVRFTSPAADVLLPAVPATLTAEASDDRQVTRVEFLDDGRVVGTDTTAPYAVPYRPAFDDVGRSTLVVRAYDDADQTSTDLRAVRVDRFAARGLTARVTPARDTRAPFRFRTSGRLRAPDGLTPAQACQGTVSVQVKAGTRTLSTRRAALRRDCTYASAVRLRSRARFGRRGALRFVVRFAGNAVVQPSRPVVRTARTRRAAV